MTRISWPRNDLEESLANTATSSIDDMVSAWQEKWTQPKQPAAPEVKPVSFTSMLSSLTPWAQQDERGRLDSITSAAQPPEPAGNVPGAVATGAENPTPSVPKSQPSSFLDMLPALTPWATPKPAPESEPARASTTPPAAGIADARPVATSGTPSAMPQASAAVPSGTVSQMSSTGSHPSAPAGGSIDNSSREAFVRSAWPYMLEAAGGNTDAAEMMLAAAISENGDVGKGGDFVGNNFFGIKGKGDAGSFNAATWEDYGNGRTNIRDDFAAYSSPVTGFRAFFSFLQENSRYKDALARYQQTGDATQLFRDVNAAGYATDKQWASKVENIRANQVAPVVRSQTAGAPTAGGAPPPVPPAGGGDLAAAGRGLSDSTPLANPAAPVQDAYRMPLGLPTDREALTGAEYDPRGADSGPWESGYATPPVSYGDAGDEPQTPASMPYESARNSTETPGNARSNVEPVEPPSAISAGQNARAGMADQEELAPRSPSTIPNPLSAAAEAGAEAYNDPLWQAAPAVPRAIKIVSDTFQAFGDAAARQVAATLGVTDEELFSILGYPVSGQDIAGFAGSLVADPTNYVGAGAARDPLLAVGKGLTKDVIMPAVRGVARTGREALEQGTEAVGTLGRNIGEGLAANAENVARADARMAAEGSTAAPGTLGQIPEQFGRPYPDIRRDVQGTVRETLGQPSSEMLADSRFPREAVHPDLRAEGIGPRITPQVDTSSRLNAGFGMIPDGESRRMYHGTAGAFGRPDPGQFDPNGMFGPGYYVTSDPRVANSYAETRGAVDVISGDDAKALFQQMAEATRRTGRQGADIFAAALESKTRGIPTWANINDAQVRRMVGDAGLESRVSMIDDELWEPVRQMIDGAYQPRGANVRAVDVPTGLRLFDAEAPQRQIPELLDSIEQALAEPHLIDRFRNAMRDQATRSRGMTGQSVYDALDQTMSTLGHELPRSSPSPSSAGGPFLAGKEGANAILQRAGYEGVRYDGGKIMGIKGDDGNTIFHDAVVVFPESLDRIRNAFSGEVGGATLGVLPSSRTSDPLSAVNRALGQGVASAVSGGTGAAAADQLGDPNDPNRQAKAFAAGALGPVLGARAVRALVGKGGANLSDAALATLGNVPNTPQGNQIARNVARAAAQQGSQIVNGKVVAASSKPANLIDLLQGYRYSVGMLGNVGTGLVNLIGGPVSVADALAVDVVRTGLLKGYPIPAIMEAGSLVTGLKDASVAALGTALGFVPQRVRNAPDFRPPLAERVEGGALAKAGAWALDTPGRLATQTPDAFFNTLFERMGQRRAANEIMMENGTSRLNQMDHIEEVQRLLNTPTSAEAQRIAEGAKKFADEMTYKGKAGPVEEWLGSRFRPGNRPATSNDSMGRQVADLAGSFVMPFFGSLFKIHKLAASHVPLLGEVADRSIPQSERFARQLVGTGFALWMADLAAKELTTGPGPTDPDEKARWLASGKQEWSTYLPGIGYVKTDSLAQAAPIIKPIAAYFDAQRYGDPNEKDVVKQWDRTVRTMMGAFENFPVVSALQAVYKMGEKPVEGAADLATTIGSSFVPAVVRANEASKDPYQRTVDTNAPMAEQIKQRALNRLGSIPGIGSRQDSPPVLNRETGDPMPNPRQGIGAFIPQPRQQQPTDPVIAEMSTYGINLDKSREKFSFTRAGADAPDGVQGSVPVPLKPAWQAEWLAARREALSQSGPALKADPEYAGAPDAAKKQAWERQVRRAEQYADRAVKSAHWDEIQQMIQGAPPAPPARRAS